MLCRQTDSNLTAYRRHHAMHGCALRSHCTLRCKMQAIPLAVGRVLLPPPAPKTLLNSRVFLMLCRQTDSNLTAYRRHHAMHGCALRSHCTLRCKMQAIPLAVGRVLLPPPAPKTLLNSRVFLMLCRQTDSNLTAYRRHHAMHGCALRSHCTLRCKMQAIPLAVGRVLLPPPAPKTLLNSRVFLNRP